MKPVSKTFVTGLLSLWIGSLHGASCYQRQPEALEMARWIITYIHQKLEMERGKASGLYLCNIVKWTYEDHSSKRETLT
jgi:hypothetical protein